MKLAALFLGAFMGGYMLPELLRLLSTRQFSVPVGMNFACAITTTLLTYGVPA